MNTKKTVGLMVLWLISLSWLGLVLADNDTTTSTTSSLLSSQTNKKTRISWAFTKLKNSENLSDEEKQSILELKDILLKMAWWEDLTIEEKNIVSEIISIYRGKKTANTTNTNNSEVKNKSDKAEWKMWENKWWENMEEKFLETLTDEEKEAYNAMTDDEKREYRMSKMPAREEWNMKDKATSSKNTD